jgi:chromatin assembly factor 1 subunit A
MMEDPPALTTKRPREEEDTDPHPATPARTIVSDASSPLSPAASIQTPSPLKALQLGDSAPTADVSNGTQSTQATHSATQPAKRRRLTEKEKEEQRLEKEAKAKATAERRAQKEVKDKLKAEKKAQKEEDEKHKAEEKAKKERVSLLEALARLLLIL